mmetsp:Transcript_955/g.1913  ORF Transcript_955/g.1913 Transcript_955/m.1913 type:complete len:309 (+) Transcript_955:84-1010(+)
MNPLKEVQAALPTERVEVRPGRVLAVHHRPGRFVNQRPGDVAIFVHGSCASLVQWRAQIEHMAAAGLAVVAYDFLGCGRSAKPHDWGAYAFDELYRDLVAVARRYGASETSSRRNLVIAHSMGCSLALRLAAEWGTNGVSVAALALLGATDVVPAAAMSPLFRLPLCLLDRLQPLLSAGFEARALHEETRAGKTADHRGLIELCRACNGMNPMFMCKAYYRQLEVPTAHQLALVRAPALLLCGEQDLLVPADSSKQLQSLLPSAELQVVPQTSHQMMQEQPAVVNAALTAFFSSCGSSNSVLVGPALY